MRVAEQQHPLDPEVFAQLVEVAGVILGPLRAGIGGPLGALGAAWVEQDEREALAEPGEVAEVAGREPRPTGMADE
jgi:hypothetical protein